MLCSVVQRVAAWFLQSTGALPPEQIVQLAFEVLQDKLDTLIQGTAALDGFPTSALSRPINGVETDRVSAEFKNERREAKREHPSSGWDRDFHLDLS